MIFIWHGNCTGVQFRCQKRFYSFSLMKPAASKNSLKNSLKATDYRLQIIECVRRRKSKP